jgi:diguanylate cyclase (GGDEF)-like protein
MFLYRRVFSAATISLGAGAASAVFHAAPAAIAGPAPLSGTHADTWLCLAAGCALLSWLVNNAMVVAAIRLATPEMPLRDAFGGRTALKSDLIEVSMAVLVAFVTAVAPVVIIPALPLVVFGQRYLMNAQLVSQTRVDAQSGALTGGIWRYEADVEAYRAQRKRTRLAVVLAEIDDFTSIGEMAGSGAAGMVLRAVAAELADGLSSAAQIGRLRGGTFAAVLPEVGEDEARQLAERIRDHVYAESVVVETGDQLDFIFRPSVSVGVAGQTDCGHTMSQLIAMADDALAGAKASGGNRVRVPAAGTG